MNRPRKSGRHLPRRMIEAHGSYYLLQPIGVRRNKHIPLGRARGVIGKTEQQLLAEALRRYAEFISGADQAAGTMTRFIDQWLNTVLPQYAEKTQIEYRRMCALLRRTFFEFNVDQVRPADIAQFVDVKFSDKPNTANKYKALLSVLFAYAVRRGMRDDNPCRDVRGLSEKKRKRYVTDQELAAIRQAALYWEKTELMEDGKEKVVEWVRVESGSMIVCLIDLAVMTGQRIGDLLSLEWRDVLPDGIIFTPSKTRHSTGVRIPIKMSAQLRAVLDRAHACSIEGKPSTYVIHTLDGEPYTYSGAHTAWKRAIKRAAKTYLRTCAQAGVKPDPSLFSNLHSHDLKRKALTDATFQGKDAQRLGGHADPKMTARYIEAVGIEWIDPVEISGTVNE